MTPIERATLVGVIAAYAALNLWAWRDARRARRRADRVRFEACKQAWLDAMSASRPGQVVVLETDPGAVLMFRDGAWRPAAAPPPVAPLPPSSEWPGFDPAGAGGLDLYPRFAPSAGPASPTPDPDRPSRGSC